jgi:ribose 5-phosphate isomerase B
MIALGSDHGGFNLKERVKVYLDEIGVEYKDFGTYSDERTDYPIYVEKVVDSIKEKESDKGILICTTGNGVSIAANKTKGIRCANCFNEEMARLAKAHNNANILAMPAGFVSEREAVLMVRTWLATEFMGGRHSERLKMIEDIENRNMK